MEDKAQTKQVTQVKILKLKKQLYFCHGWVSFEKQASFFPPFSPAVLQFWMSLSISQWLEWGGDHSLFAGHNMKNTRAGPSTFSNLQGNAEQGVSGQRGPWSIPAPPGLAGFKPHWQLRSQRVTYLLQGVGETVEGVKAGKIMNWGQNNLIT